MDEIAGTEAEFLRVRLEMLNESLPAIAVQMFAVLGSFMEAGFSAEHAFQMTESTYERVLTDFSL